MQIFTYADYLKYSKIFPEGVRGGNEDMKFEKLFMELLEDKERKGKIEGKIEGEKRGEKLGIAKAITQMVKCMLQKHPHEVFPLETAETEIIPFYKAFSI